MDEQLNELKKQTRYAKITCFSVVGILVVMVLSAILIIPKVNTALDTVNAMFYSANAVLVQVENMHLDEMPIEDLVTTLDDLGEKIDKLDFEALNNTITSLEEVSNSMESFFSLFKR